MTERKEFPLYLPMSSKLLVFGMLSIFTAVGIVFVSGLLTAFSRGAPPRVFGLIWLCIVVFNWYYALSIPHRILITQTGEIVFRSLLGRRSAMPSEIRSISPQGSRFGFLIVRTSQGKIRILNQFD